MKNKIIKSTILFSFFAVFAVLAFPANASTLLNTGSYDPVNFVLSSNYSASQGCSSCWATSTPASAGQTVSIFIGYHNSGNEATQNLRIKLSPQSTGAVSGQTFTGTISADNASAKSASASVSISSGTQTLTYIPGSTLWYPDQNQTNPTALLMGQSGAEIFSTGLNLGSILPDSTCSSSNTSCHQGSIVARFLISNSSQNSSNCTINNFSATPTTINSGATSALTWNTSGCTNVSITPSINSSSTLSLSGSASTFALNTTTTYTLSAYGSSNTASPLSTTVYVNQVQNTCYINSFYPDNDSVYSGNSTIVHWSVSSGCNNVSVTNIGGGLSNTGSQVIGPIYGNTTYTIYASGPTNTATAQSFTVGLLQINQNYNNYNNCYITNAYASPARINQGESTTLHWAVSGSYSYATISGVSNTFYSGNNYYTTPALYANTTYTVNVYGCSSSSGNISYPINVYVNYQPDQNSTVDNNTVKTIYVSGGGESPYIKLSITPDFENVSLGDVTNYDVAWKNISGSTLKNATLRMKLPKEMTFKKSDIGEFSTSDNTLTEELGDLKAGDFGKLKFQTSVSSTKTHKLVTTASVVFTLPSTAQGDATAYAINKLVDANGNSLGANALFSGFMPNSLLGWLIVILVIMAVVAIARYFYKKPIA